MKALLRASLSVGFATRDNLFWKKYIQWDMMWFWEVRALFKTNELPVDHNFKEFYLWLDAISTPKYGAGDEYSRVLRIAGESGGYVNNLRPITSEASIRRHPKQ